MCAPDRLLKIMVTSQLGLSNNIDSTIIAIEKLLSRGYHYRNI